MQRPAADVGASCPRRLTTVIKDKVGDMTQLELSKKATLTEAYISQLLKGNKNPSRAVALSACR
jgi:predicted transcriptional regulator